MLTWPHPHGDWADSLDAIEALFVELATAIAAHQRLLIVCYDAAHREHVRHRLSHTDTRILEAARFALQASDDSWARDHGPITVFEDSQAVLLDFQFNGWGGKFAAERDNRITAGLVEQGILTTSCRHQGTILEGGSIDTDGEGTLLTTTRCLLAPNRNPDMDRAGWEQLFRDQFGISRTLWLEEGALLGDDTDGHIDMLARFCDPATIAYSSCEYRDDPQFGGLQAMAEALTRLRRANDAPYRLVPLPVPAPLFDAEGDRLPASYANFLIINGAVLVPIYGVAEDAIALQRLSQCFPGRVVHPVDCRAAIAQHGSLHCLTMQLPQGVNL
jgi:agmatine/peptidylarginine deiminase